MKQYLAKWAVAGFLVPVLLVGVHQVVTVPDQIFIGLWPSSIVLMALDTSPPSEMPRVIYIWSFSIALNVVLYILVGLLFKALQTFKRSFGGDHS